MADSDIQITAGSGTKVDTRTVGTGSDEHRQVMVVGDPTSTDVAPVDSTLGLSVNVTQVAGTVAIGDATNSAVVDTNGGVDNKSAAVNQLIVQDRLHVFNGTGWDRARGDTTNGILVNVAAIDPGVGPTSLGKEEDTPHATGDTGVMLLGVRNDNHVGRAGTDGDYVPIALDGHGCVYVRGAGHDDVDIDGPVKIGSRAIAHGTNPVAVAADDRTDIFANRHGILFTIGGHPNTITRSVHISDANGAQTDASIVGTINTGTKVVVTAISVTVDSATTAPGGIAVKVGFGATTIPADSTTGADGVLLDHPGIAAGSGIVVGNGSGILGIGGDGEELRLTCEDPVGGNLAITFSYYTIES